MELKTKDLPVSGVKVLDAEQGIVEAYVAGIGNKDSVGDIIQPGAFVDSIAARKPKGVWSHDWDKPVSKTLEIREVSAGSEDLPVKMKSAGIGGLYVKTQFNLNTQRGKDAFADVVFYGEEAEWSIGYREVETEWDDKQKALLLQKVDLYEYSPVLFGANPLTSTVGIKSAVGDAPGEVTVEGLPPSIAAKVKDLVAAEMGATTETVVIPDDADPEAPVEVLSEEPVVPKDDEDAVEVKDAVPGSLEARREAICEAARGAVAAEYPDALGVYAWPEATFDTTVVVEYEVMLSDGYESGYLQFNYTFDGSEAVLTNPNPVDIVSVVVGKGEAEVLTPAVGDLLAAYKDLEECVGVLKIVSDPDGFAWAEKHLEASFKAGRVLSAKNYDALVSAHEAIGGVIEAATTSESASDGEAKSEAVVLDAPADSGEEGTVAISDPVEPIAGEAEVEAEQPTVSAEDLAFLESLASDPDLVPAE